MKKSMLMLAVIFLTMMGASISSAAGPSVMYPEDYTVAVGTTTAVLVGGWCPGRHYYAVGNWSDTYIVFHATWPIQQADVQALPNSAGIPLAPYQNGSDLNKWVDQYRIYYSSWYVLVSSVAALADVAPISIRVTYRQKQ